MRQGQLCSGARFAASGAKPANPAALDPWEAFDGYAHFHSLSRESRLSEGDQETVATITARGTGRYDVEVGDTVFPLSTKSIAGRVALWPGHVTIFEGPVGHSFAVPDPLARAGEDAVGGSSLRAPMPGPSRLGRIDSTARHARASLAMKRRRTT